MALRFRWIVQGVLAGMERPGSYHSMADDVALLTRSGVRRVVSLTERPIDASLLVAAGIDVHHAPVPDFDAPTMQQVQAIVLLVDETERAGHASAVHCLAGLGRTGTIAACYLAHRHGLHGDAAIRGAREIEPGYIQSPRQEEFVAHFAAGRLAKG
jgi:atypical dual specificity phosphatase